jgi:hypothetical protein
MVHAVTLPSAAKVAWYKGAMTSATGAAVGTVRGAALAWAGAPSGVGGAGAPGGGVPALSGRVGGAGGGPSQSCHASSTATDSAIAISARRSIEFWLCSARGPRCLPERAGHRGGQLLEGNR